MTHTCRERGIEILTFHELGRVERLVPAHEDVEVNVRARRRGHVWRLRFDFARQVEAETDG